MVIVPLRAGPVAADALYCTSPLPLPLDPDEMVSHDALLDAVQLQPALVVTVTLPVAAAAGTEALSGEIANEHPGVWEMLIVWPATTALPERDGPVVAAAANVTLPAPVPLERPWMVIHESLDVALHSHSAFAAMLTVTVPPAAPTDVLVGCTP